MMNTAPEHAGWEPTALSLGTAQLGMEYGVANHRRRPSRAEAFAILDAARELGVRSFDTAPGYGDAEVLLGEWFDARRAAECSVMTKIPALSSVQVRAEQVAAAVRSSVEDSRRRLRRDTLDCVVLHGADDLATFGSVIVDALTAEVAAGRIRSVGASIYCPEQARRVIESAALTCIQVPLNLLDHRFVRGGLLRSLAARGCVVFARSAYLQGLFALEAGALPPRMTHARPWLERLHQVTARCGLRPVDVALAWARTREGITSVLFGAESVAQVRASIEAAGRSIPDRLEADLAAVFADVPLDVVDPSRWSVRALGDAS